MEKQCGDRQKALQKKAEEAQHFKDSLIEKEMDSPEVKAELEKKHAEELAEKKKQEELER